MQPQLGVGALDLAGTGSVLDGADRYTTSLAQEADLPQGVPCAFVRVGRSLQPISFAGFHVAPAPTE